MWLINRDCFIQISISLLFFNTKFYDEGFRHEYDAHILVCMPCIWCWGYIYCDKVPMFMTTSFTATRQLLKLLHRNKVACQKYSWRDIYSIFGYIFWYSDIYDCFSHFCCSCWNYCIENKVACQKWPWSEIYLDSFILFNSTPVKSFMGFDKCIAAHHLSKVLLCLNVVVNN